MIAFRQALHAIQLCFLFGLIPAQAFAQYSLLVSDSADRSSPYDLDDTSQSDVMYVFVAPETNIKQAKFFLDDPVMTGTPIQVENIIPYDFAGTSKDGSAHPFDAGSLFAGTHTITASIRRTDRSIIVISSSFTVPGTSNLPPIAAFTFGCTELSCTFDASGSSDDDGLITAYSWDFGDGSGGSGVSASHTYASAGTRTVTLTVVDDDQAVDSSSANVTVAADNSPPIAAFTFGCTELSCTFDASGSSDDDGLITAYSWDFGDGSGGSGVSASHTYASAGTRTVTLTVIDDDEAGESLHRQVTVSTSQGCSAISTLDCEQIRISGDFVIGFDGGDSGLTDNNGVGTGFTMVDPPTIPGNPQPVADAPGYWADKLQVDALAGTIRITTTAGIQHLDNNNLDNALGVGLNLPSKPITAQVTLIDLPQAPGGWAQAGLWIGSAGNFGRGTSEDDHIKIVVASPSAGSYMLEAAMEQAGTRISQAQIALPNDVSTVTLLFTANPGRREIEARYDLGSGSQLLKSFQNVPDAWFSFDQAGIDPEVATRSFGGIFATHRRSNTPQTFSFRDFSLTEESIVSTGSFEFDKWSIPVTRPTAIAYGPDNRLYVSELFGTIRAFTLDHVNQTVVAEQIIDSVRATNGGNRLTLGLDIDPMSTAEDVVIWVSHSDGSVNNGVANSGMLSRLSGPSFSTVENRVTGLPRAIANHAINGIHFGPDGKLYVAAGGNTGAGAANLANTEFGDRPEQPLSAAILVADVNAPGFSGDCATPIGQFGIPSTCDVFVYASGMRNSYGLTWHSNGSMYATDNGLGVTGTYPPISAPPCTGLADPNQHNPGTQPDLLHRVIQGKYYGHPNPYRDECVFKNGSYQGAAPLGNYDSSMFELGYNLSANAIIEYRGDAFFSTLMGQLLIANYSSGDNVTRVKLSASGTSVVETDSLLEGFSDPLPLGQDPLGTIYVGEFNGNRVVAHSPRLLEPAPVGGWTEKQTSPAAILDAGGAGIGNNLFTVGGKTSSGHVSSLYIYDVVTDTWTAGPDLPGPAVENPAVVALNGAIYVFGGSTAPFSGAVSNAARYDSETGSWTALAPMTTARGGATAKALGGKIFVVGGMDGSGSSLSTVEIYDPVANTWTASVPLQTRRDNPGSAVFDNKLYVFGGRIRNSDGSTVNGTLSTIEFFDPVTQGWTFGANMPTGRRAMTVGTISGRAQVMGGEKPIIADNEEYDPVTDTWRTLTPMPNPRHGAAAATIGGAVYISGGGPTGGSSFTNSTEAFRY